MGVATAIIGSAIIGAGASAIGASKQAKAAKTAAAAQTDASNQQIALQKEIYQDQRGLQQPYYQAGLQGLYGQSGIMDLLGKGGGGQATQGNALAVAQPANQNYASGNYGVSPIGAAAPTSGPNYAGYVAGNQDLQAAFQGLTPEMQRGITSLGYDKNRDGRIDAGEYGAFHYARYGQGEGRQVPQYQPAAQPTGNALAQSTGQVGTATPVASPGATTTATPAAPTEGPMTQSLRQTPGYMFLQDEAKRQIEDSFASRGELLSGSAMNALNDRTLGIADQTYGAAVDRNFQLANLGMGAAAQITNSGNNYAMGAGNALGNIGQAQANKAIGQANAWNAGAQGVGNALMSGVGMWGSINGWGGGTPAGNPSTGTYNGVF
jgi:hypothetical protein